MIEVLTFVAVLIVVALMAITLYKVRRIHLATFAIAADAAAARQEAGTLFSQLQALSALERKLALDLPLPPLRKWAGSPDFLMVVADNIEARRPLVVMECSSGASTVVCARMLQLNGAGHVYSLEHDDEYAKATERMLHGYGLSSWATIIRAPLEHGDRHPAPWYSLEALPKDLGGVQLLVVDGPPSTLSSMARHPALDKLQRFLAKDVVVIVDDADREGERSMLERWLVEFPEFSQTLVPCEKGCVVLSHHIKP